LSGTRIAWATRPERRPPSRREPYAGREVVFYEDRPGWMLPCYGAATAETADVATVYRFLQHALQRCPEDWPLRGPGTFFQGEFRYTNQREGDIARFTGAEAIDRDASAVYRATYLGGYVDVRRE
jgi:hypothetical protein